MKICNNCQSQMNDNDLFCQSCGARYEEPQPEISQDPVQPAEVAEPVVNVDHAQSVKNVDHVQPVQPPVQQPARRRVQYYTPQESRQFYPQSAYTAPVRPQYTVPYRQAVADPNMVAETHRTLKTIGKSPLFLISVIAYTVIFIIGVISTVSMFIDFSTPNMYNYFGYDDFGFDSYAMQSVNSVTAIVSMFSLIPSVLMLIGLWMTFGSAVSSSDRMKSGGLTIIKVLQIISLIGVCVVCGILAIVLILVFFVGLVDGEPEAITIAFFMMLLCGGIFAFLIIYQVKVLSTINTIRETVNTGIPSDKVSGFVAVIGIMSAVFSFIGVIFTAVGGAIMEEFADEIFGYGAMYVYEMDITTILSIVSSVCSVAMLVTFSALIFNYRTKMRNLMYKYSNKQQPIQYAYAENTYSQDVVNETVSQDDAVLNDDNNPFNN